MSNTSTLPLFSGSQHGSTRDGQGETAPSDATRTIADNSEAGTTKDITKDITITNTNATEHEIIHKSIQTKSFVEHIKYIVELKSDTVFSTWYNEKGKATNNYTFQQLWDEAGHCAHLIRNKWGAKKDDRVVLCYDFGLHFFAMFVGCLRAGVTAVLVYPPGPPLVKSLTKMNKVIGDCAPALILTQTSINMLRAADRANPASKSRSLWPSGIKYKVTDRIIRHDPFIANKTNGKNKQAKNGFLSSLMSGRSSSSPPSFDEPNIKGSDLAFLQYTSGSTGDPKGVMVTHNALRANIELVQSYWFESFKDQLGGASQVPERIATCSWLPQYHDMGLIEMGIAPLAGAYRSHMISPVAFIRNPLLWVDLMSQHKCHISAAPDFGYRLVTRKYNEALESPKGQTNPIPKLDLSSVLHLQNAAEPIRLDTEKNFADAFCQYNLREDWFLAAYGLAENVVGVSYNHGFHLSTMRPDEDLQPFVAIAQRSNLHSSVDIIIVDPDICVQRPDNVTGEIWVAGASVTAGYYNQPQLSKEAFQATMRVEGDSSSDANASADGKMYLRTGDYGFYQDDYLYICGRKKDIVIVNGVNYYPQDIEHAVEEASSAVRSGCVAAFSSDDSGNDGQLEIVFEIRASHVKDAKTVCQQVRRNVISQIGLTPATVAAVEERSISKTTSGKIQRRQSRHRLHAGSQKMVFESKGALDITGKQKDIESQLTDETLSVDSTIGQRSGFGAMGLCEIVKSCTGSNTKPDDEWKDIGLSSMMELELRQSLSQRYNTELPANVFQLFPKVLDLNTFLEASKGEPLPTNLPTLKRIVTIPNEKPLSQTSVAIIQAIGVLVVVLIFSFPTVPVYEVGKAIADSDVLSGHEWVLLPLIVPVWAITLTFVIILSKWIVIGRYTEGYANQTSIYFIRWWFVDRLVDIWERFVGRIIAGTPLMMLFYYLMGADIHRSASVNGTVREFDLVKVDANAMVNTNIRCRVFGPWKDEQQGPSVKFRKTQVGSNAAVNGVLLAGVSVGSGCQVQRVTVLVEGSQAPPNTSIRGNPAFVEAPSSTLKGDDEESATATATGDTTSTTCTSPWIVLGMMKLLWLLVELCFAFACFVGADQLVGDGLPDWRYSSIIYWIALFGLTSVCFLITSIILKWVLIGKKQSGPARTGTFSRFADWACDFHFYIGTTVFLDLTLFSQFWNLVLMAHGMDIDMRSRAMTVLFPPSKLDLITVRRSFVSFCDLDVQEGDQYKAITIEDSSIGMSLTCGPGVTIRKAMVTPCTHVTSDMINIDHHPNNVPLSTLEFLILNINNTLLHIIILAAVTASLVPSYELLAVALKPDTTTALVPIFISASTIIQTIIWLVLLRVIETISIAGSTTRGGPWCISLHMVYYTCCQFFQAWSFESVVWGTPIMNALLRFRGATIQGKMLYFGFRIYEAPLLTFADRAVMDDAIICGHYGVFSTLSLGTSYIDGLMHQMSFALMRKGSATKGAALVEHAPWKMVSDMQASDKRKSLPSSDTLLSEEGEGRKDSQDPADDTRVPDV